MVGFPDLMSWLQQVNVEHVVAAVTCVSSRPGSAWSEAREPAWRAATHLSVFHTGIVQLYQVISHYSTPSKLGRIAMHLNFNEAGDVQNRSPQLHNLCQGADEHDSSAIHGRNCSDEVPGRKGHELDSYQVFLQTQTQTEAAYCSRKKLLH